MNRRLAAVLAISLLAPACTEDAAPPNEAPQPAAAPAPAPEPTATAAAAPPAPPEPTPEEKKKMEAAKELAADRAKWEAAHKAEAARWTPELHAAVKPLAEKSYPSGKAALTAVLAGKQRSAADAARDKYRHPAETLAFFGFSPTMTVLDIGPGEGWYTEILAPALAKKGHYIATNGDPNGPADQRSTFYAQRFKAFVDLSPELYGKVETVLVDANAPKLPMEKKLDMALIMRGVHGMVSHGVFDQWLAEIHKALKPGGVLGIEEHRAPAGADPVASSKKGYVPEAYVIQKAEAAGFKLAGKSEINANPKDTKDYPEGVWSLPPTYREGDKNHDKYAAIGESDRMTLKFVSVAPPKPKK
ncbi:MAG TPA: methyltransferase domain-containing protein [Minicystis sp.]|nr:methyltransferase domain-containing protein [Minicystis sp.]